MEFLRVDPPGCDLAVIRRPHQGGKPAATLVLLHGLGDASSVFAQALEAAALAPFELALFDLLGHGSSDKPANFDYSPASHGAVLFQAMRKLGLPGPLYLVGYSLGGAVAVELSRFPVDGLAGLVLVEPALDATRMRFAGKVAEVSEGEFRARFADFLAPYASEEASDADRLWVESAAFASSTAFHRSAKGALEAARRGELLRHLRESALPRALILSRRTRDEWTAARDLEAEGAPVFLVDAPHQMPMLERPEEFYAALRRAVEALATRPP
jgi:pimeloyl-ACP methyl ester carboxylesterase